MLEPLRIRDFRLLWTGMTVSLVGDGIFLVALAWQTYDLSSSPSTLGWISAAYVSPMVVVLLAGGVLTDRVDRRMLMIAADLIRAGSIGAIGALAVAGQLGLWELAVLAAVTGVGDALFAPAFGSIVPDIVPRDLLPQANSLDQFVRPVSGLVGPAIAGVLIASSGVGTAFLADAATFLRLDRDGAPPHSTPARALGRPVRAPRAPRGVRHSCAPGPGSGRRCSPPR